MRKNAKSVKSLSKKALDELLSRKDPLQDFIDQAKFIDISRFHMIGSLRR